MQIIAAFIVMLALAGSGSPAFGQTPPPVATVPHEVLAFYYPWYGSAEMRGRPLHWGHVDTVKHAISTTAHYPEQGAYDSADPRLINCQIDAAKSNGITGFISSWWGQKDFEDAAFEVLLKCAQKKNFKVTVYWEKAPGNHGTNQISNAVNDLVYLLTRYGTNEAFLKVDGKPVIFVYERVMAGVPLKHWPFIISQARWKAGEFKLIADDYQESYTRSFAGLHRYNISWAVKGKKPDALHSWAAQYYSNAVNLCQRQDCLSCVTVIPGYDDTKIRKPGRNVDRQDGEVYRILWDEAIKSKADWVLITSWNEWHEGSEIEPSIEYGDRYLKLTGEYSKRFMARPMGLKSP